MKRKLLLGCLPVALWGCQLDPTNSCRFANDDACDDGRPGALTALCVLGTDEADCADTQGPSGPNSCLFANDGECDDGRPGSDTSTCPAGSDEADCAGI